MGPLKEEVGCSAAACLAASGRVPLSRDWLACAEPSSLRKEAPWPVKAPATLEKLQLLPLPTL